MNRAFVVANQKGGVGKSTCAVNLAYQVAQMGYKTCIIDADPQGNATCGLGYIPEELEQTIYDLFLDDISTNIQASDIIVCTEYDNLSIMPANISLADVEIANYTGIELVIRYTIESISDHYDYIFIDTPPSLGKLTVSALTGGTHLLIPIQCEYYALQGVRQLVETFQRVKRKLNRNLVIGGAFATMYDARTKVAKRTVELIQGYFKNRAFNTFIPRTVRITESQEVGIPVQVYEPENPASSAFVELAKEVIA